MNQQLMEKYARLAVLSGSNVQKGQLLVITAQVKDYPFVQLCVKEAYQAGASEVIVEWSDEQIDKMGYQYCSTETLSNVPQWAYDKKKDIQDRGCAYLHILSETPGLLADIDQQKIRSSSIAYRKKFADLKDYTMANHGQWSIVALPSLGWAKKVFPQMSDEEAIEALSQAILKTVHVREDNDPVEEWKQLDNQLSEHCKVLNQYHFAKLHFTNSLGTDLYVSLVKNHCWAGGSCFTDNGVEFNPNMPTEEVFCMPDKDHVDGVVYASKPLNYGGKVIQNFWFRFENGRVVDFSAENDQDTLQTLLDMDEGSRHLGEVALIGYDTPISLSKILFYETLFDENASCHLALGQSYPENVIGGTSMSAEELANEGGNSSVNHVDFMFGTEDMDVVGIKENGEEVQVFKNGNFVF